jgi:hypothetical protein
LLWLLFVTIIIVVIVVQAAGCLSSSGLFVLSSGALVRATRVHPSFVCLRATIQIANVLSHFKLDLISTGFCALASLPRDSLSSLRLVASVDVIV